MEETEEKYLLECPPGTVLNPITKRCDNILSKNGQIIYKTLILEFDPLSVCPEGYIYNAVTELCVSLNTPEGKLINEVSKNKHIKCPCGYVIDSRTGKCVKVDSKAGIELVGKYSCLRYPSRAASYEFNPLEHQEKLLNYFYNSNIRGILMFWSLGTGKTCGSILLADTFLNKFKNVYVLSTGSLRENFIYQYCVICGYNPKTFNKKFKFITYNRSDIIHVFPKPEEMEGSIIIVDEVHTIINGFLNESETYEFLYAKLRMLQNVKMILLSGTPILRRPEEFYYLMNLIDRIIDFDTYMSNLIFEDNTTYFNDYLLNLYSKYISTVAVKLSEENFPKIEREYIFINMTETQYEKYKERKLEEEEPIFLTEKDKLFKPELYKTLKRVKILRTLKVKSRQICNMYYPTEDSVRYPDLLKEDGGWIDKESIDSLSQYAPKFIKILEIITSRPGKAFVYSEFKTKYGIYMLSALLKYYRISHLIFSGDLNDEGRRQITDLFNNENNLRGEQYKVLLGTDATILGQNFLQVRTLIIVEQSIIETDIIQVEGRVKRYNSHILLNPDERNLKIYRLFAAPPDFDLTFEEAEKQKDIIISSDYEAYKYGQVKIGVVRGLINQLSKLPPVPTI
ncbi:MAG: SNF2-related protein [Candidatus Micrarchaeaceae archaeon]